MWLVIEILYVIKTKKVCNWTVKTQAILVISIGHFIADSNMSIAIKKHSLGFTVEFDKNADGNRN